MAKLFDSPTTLLILLLVMVLLFGAPKLPGMARSLGQSLRIFKSEVTELKNDQPVPAGGSVEGRSAHEDQGVSAPYH